MLDCWLFEYSGLVFFWYNLFVINFSDFLGVVMVVWGVCYNLFIIKVEFVLDNFFLRRIVFLFYMLVVVCNVCSRGDIIISFIWFLIFKVLICVWSVLDCCYLKFVIEGFVYFVVWVMLWNFCVWCIMWMILFWCILGYEVGMLMDILKMLFDFEIF